MNFYLHLTFFFSGHLQKYLFKGKWSLSKSYFKQSYCHACHTRFTVLLRKFTNTVADRWQLWTDVSFKTQWLLIVSANLDSLSFFVYTELGTKHSSRKDFTKTLTTSGGQEKREKLRLKHCFHTSFCSSPPPSLVLLKILGNFYFVLSIKNFMLKFAIL